MGFFRNIKITNTAFQISYKIMKLMSSMRRSDPDIAPNIEQVLENLGDELAIIARDFCLTEKERTYVIKGLKQGLEAHGLSQTTIQNIVTILTHRIMAGAPETDLANEIENYMDGLQVSADKSSRINAALKQVSFFMKASLLLVDNEVLNREVPKISACLYFAGAADFLAQHYKLSDDQSLDLIYKCVKNFGLSETNAKLFVQYIPQMSHEPHGRKAMIEGGRTIQQWLSGQDVNAPIRLTQLVYEWAEESI